MLCKQLKLLTILAILLLGLFSCQKDTPGNIIEFQEPPEGWERYGDSLLQYRVWIPTDWVIAETYGSDLGVISPTFFYPTDPDMQGNITILLEDSKTSLWFAGHRNNGYYTLEIGPTTIPCRQYENTRSLSSLIFRRECVIGPYIRKEFDGETMHKFYYSILLETTHDQDSILEPIWKMILYSFLVEQPP